MADPLPPVWEFSHSFTVFLPFYKPLNWKKQRKIWSGFGSDPSPQFGNFSHIIPFFSDNVPYKEIISKILIVKIESPLIRYDMVTDIPNAYFVEVGIYKWHGSPTYTLGR